MTTFILAFVISTFCAWWLTDAGFYLEAIILTGLLGFFSGMFAAHIAHGGNDD